MAKRSPRTIYLIKMAELIVRTGVEGRLRAFDITGLQYTVLSMVDRNDGLSVADLARGCRVTPQSMGELVLALEQKALVVRQHDPANRRILRIALTAVGRALFSQCDRLMDGLEDELFGHLGDEALAALRRALDAVLKGAREPAEAGSAAPS